MSDLSVENPPAQDYPRSMETRVALLEQTTGDLRFEVREVKTLIRDLTTEMREGFRAISAKFDTTDKAIADLRVDMQSVRTEIQSVRTDVERGLRDNLTKTVAWFGLMISLAVAVITIVVKLPHF